jgi:hypothetical protein
MSNLSIFNKEINSIFQLLGENENDISYSIGYTLANSPSFLKVFLSKTMPQFEIVDFQKVRIKLQNFEKKHGFTDFEVFSYGEFCLIIEAKKGFNFPTEYQLRTYCNKPTFKTFEGRKRIIVFTDSNRAVIDRFFKLKEIDDIEIQVISYREIYSMLNDCYSNGNNIEKHLNTQLKSYLKQIITMQKIDSNWVYVVSLGWGKANFTEFSFREVVQIKNIYFHPVGNRYPAEPLNYIAFRYDGKLQSIHHVESFVVEKNPNNFDKDFLSCETDPLYYYKLGPAIIPNKIVKNGGSIIKDTRVWCMLDTLLTCDTISEASQLSKQRESKQKEININ